MEQHQESLAGGAGRPLSGEATKPLLISLAALLLAGCGSSIAHRVPTVPPAGLDVARADLDSKECEAATRPGMDERARHYAACMIERGHAAWTDIDLRGPFSKTTTAYMVRPMAGRQGANALEDLTVCSLAVRQQVRAWSVLLIGVVNSVFTAADTEAIDRTYRACMEPRGYAVEVWRP